MLDPDGRWSAPNISSFTVSEQTIGNAGNILSALMLPWKSMPGIDHLTDALAAIRRKYPGHFAEYFEGVIRKQVSYHLSLEEKNHQYWGLTMLALKQSVGLERVAFFGAGSYCNDLVTRTIPRDLWPALVIDTFPENKKIATLPSWAGRKPLPFHRLLSPSSSRATHTTKVLNRNSSTPRITGRKYTILLSARSFRQVRSAPLRMHAMPPRCGDCFSSRPSPCIPTQDN